MNLTQKHLDSWFFHKQQLNKVESQIVKRIDEIIRLIFSTCGYKLHKSFCWYFYGAQEGNVGHLELNKNSHTINFYCEDLFYNKYIPYLGYTEEFPVEFLTMSDKEIEKIILKEIEEEKQKESQKKQKAQQNKKEKAALIQAAKKKLTAAEKKVLGIK